MPAPKPTPPDRTPAVTEPIPDWPFAMPEVAREITQAIENRSWGRYEADVHDRMIASMMTWLGPLHVWPCCSGTIAVELALRGCGVQPGQEVILAGYDFPGNFRAIELVGAQPVLVDLAPGRWTINEDEIAGAANDKTSAILVSHMHGDLVDMARIMEVAKTLECPVIEDACQVPGAFINGKRAGTSGDVGVFSFGGSKLLTAGRGGAVVSRHENFIQRIRIFAERGNDAFPLAALQAAALIPQFGQLQDWNRQRGLNATKVINAIKECRHLKTLVTDDRDALMESAFYKIPLSTRTAHSRGAIIAALQAEGVPADVGFRGFVRRPPRRARTASDLRHARIASEQTILLHHPFLLGSDKLIDQVVAAIQKVDRALD